MPPKVRITKEEIVRAAVGIVRRSGIDAVNAREIAAELNCSTQPVFSNFRSMDELRRFITDAAEQEYQEYIRREIGTRKYPEYKASGIAYIRFAKEEKELFRLLFMRDRSKEETENENEKTKPIFDLVENATGLTGDQARLFHFEMWAFVHGIAVMSATGYLQPDPELISSVMTDVYQGLKKRFEAKEE